MLEAGNGPLADQRALERADGRQNLQSETALRGGGVHRIPERPESDPAPIEILDRLQQVQHRARQAIQLRDHQHVRSEEHTSELQSLMRNSYAVFCLTKK